MKLSGRFFVTVERENGEVIKVETGNSLTKRGAIHFLTYAVAGNIPWILGGELYDWIDIWWCGLHWIAAEDFVALHRDDAIEYTEWPSNTVQTDNRQWKDGDSLGGIEWDDRPDGQYTPWPNDPLVVKTTKTMTVSYRSPGARDFQGLWISYYRKEGSIPYALCHAVIASAAFDEVLEIHKNDKVTVKYTLTKY